MTKKGRLQISVISPVYNEEKHLAILYEKLVTELTKLKLFFEIIFIAFYRRGNLQFFFFLQK